MPTPPLDPALAREAHDAIREHGNASAAARALGLPRQTLVGRARQYTDPAIMDSMAAVGTNMRPALTWAKTKSAEGTSYSVLLKPDPLPDETLDRIRTAFEGMDPAAPAPPPETVMADLCTVYPVMDVHYGMRAWGEQTGSDDYDTGLADSDMDHALRKVMAITPNSDTAVLLIGGDFFHADDERAETPGSKHKLDVDGRHWRTLERGIAFLATTVARLSEKHSRLIVRVLRGNHDEHSHLVLTFALAERYRESERIEIERNPRDLFMLQWGRCAIFGHHGDKAKPERLTLYLSDVCPFWSATRHRYALTGHVHHDQAKDVGPLRWESLRAFCPPDAYAASMGYGARRALQSMTFDKADGLVLRALDPIERLT